MLIAYFTNLYPRATDTFIQREVAALRRRGFEVRTFSVRRPGSDHDVSPEVIAEKRDTHYLLPTSLARLLLANAQSFVRSPRRYIAAMVLAVRTRRPGLREFALQLAYFQEAVLLSEELLRLRVAHVHNHLGDNSGTVTLLTSALSGIGYSITIHGPHIFFDPTHWALREKLHHSRFIACISHYCRSQMMLFSNPDDWGRLKIVRCGIDSDGFAYTEVRPEVKKLLYAGRLAVEKGLPVLFESLRVLRDRRYEFELTLLGDGSDRSQLEELAQRLGIEDRLIFAGYASQERVRECLLRSDMFVLPSFAEGVPVSLMEAMACGVPVVSTYVGGVVELVVPEETGLLVQAGDSAALGAAIMRYFEDLELRRKVSRGGREWVIAHFNLDRESAKLADLFAACADEAPAR